ncbi:hypothetical protein QYF36_014957 [Acer negundo]|nr:hypothetical protein QYF36_014957 [Acer negundo]
MSQTTSPSTGMEFDSYKVVILPKLGVPFPFPKPHKQVYPLIFGEWFNANTEVIINRSLQTGAAPNISDAYTINGLPGPLYNCSAKDTFKLKVKPGKTYLLRLINAALNDELFFSIANHSSVCSPAAGLLSGSVQITQECGSCIATLRFT